MLEQDQNQQNIPEKVNNIERPVLAEKPPIQKKAEVSIKKQQEGLLNKLGISNSILGHKIAKEKKSLPLILPMSINACELSNE
ncbi:unnamed protein product [Blepharisma stoltei]|uniref:Uncharacterized protein n=1 Tax=Blepharisma stoltei TaxID=1481888 RepID=A0AAU9ILE6_9CILI|nr:unnamed protein product [Blepharisma stoltei]